MSVTGSLGGELFDVIMSGEWEMNSLVTQLHSYATAGASRIEMSTRLQAYLDNLCLEYSCEQAGKETWHLDNPSSARAPFLGSHNVVHLNSFPPLL